jgi:hypothetical protein
MQAAGVAVLSSELCPGGTLAGSLGATAEREAAVAIAVAQTPA